MCEKYSKAISANIAEDDSESSAISVKGFNKLSVEIPTAAIGCATSTVSVHLEGSDTSDGTFRPLTLDDAQSLTSGSAGNVNATVQTEFPDFIKVCLTNNTATAAGYACRVHCYM